MASRCSCSEVWLETRSEQHTAQPSLFIREEMMLQPQPHIDLLISGPRRIRRRGDGEGKKKKTQTDGSASGSHFLVFAVIPRVLTADVSSVMYSTWC